MSDLVPRSAEPGRTTWRDVRARDADAVSGLLLRDAELDGRARCDVRVRGARIVEVGPALRRAAGEEVLDCEGNALLPGLCDHHLHLHALAAWQRSLNCGPPAVSTPDALAAALRAAVPDEHGWIRGVGYFESVAGDLDAALLDAFRADRPVRVQHRSGALWTLNSAAVAAAGLAGADHPGIERDGDGAPTGRLWRADGWLRTRLPPSPAPDLAAVGRELARYGVTAVTDATPDLSAEALASLTAAVRDRAIPQRAHLLGLPLGERAGHPRITAGPYKIVLADSGMPELGELADRIEEAHARGRAVAVHCVSREALALLLATLAITGIRPGDRVEHAALVPDELRGDLAQRGLRVVTQPGFIADRGDDYLRDVPPADLPDLYRHASLVQAGISVGLSSDAPYGPLDPWGVMRAAVERRTAAGEPVSPSEAVASKTALAAYLSPPGDPGGAVRRVRPGGAADLVVLRVPLAAALAGPSADHVRATLIGGRRYR
ncbi:amidohydrolase family protein [Actinomadura parmotrematis]|uniref:Amidohydrolase family protein n=1 Tax=Actinomadura parmotrematis TaxID=2864039 RepID=A0ABS7FQV9_9ACTN|nr:amidohydrolase family protein [Actinomadura parmotrematis]MBW8482696.1 amidohydrolase family protein [Actinomadura parmotrematis]